MTTSTLAILVTLVIYQVLLIAIGLWAGGRTRNTTDFYLGGRQLGGLVAAISASASSSSAWTLLGVSGAAYSLGLPALWLFPATVSGFIFNWVWVAPRLRRLNQEGKEITLTQVLAGDAGDTLYPYILGLASFIILFSFIFYIAAQFAAAGSTFASTFGLPGTTSMLIGAGIIVLYTLLGGFWAASVTDTVQGLLMAVTAVILPLAALVAIGGPSALESSLAPAGFGSLFDLTGETATWAALAFVLGTMGIGLGYPGQPHVVNRFMALRDDGALRQGRVIALTWAVVIYAGMILLGWSARVLFPASPDPEQIFFQAAADLLPPVISGVMLAAVLSAIMSTADSQLLVAASSVTHDLSRALRRTGESLARARVVVLVISSLAIATALLVPEDIFSRVLFAWHALGAAFGPLLIVRLTGARLHSVATLAAMGSGFGLTVIFHFRPEAPGDIIERVVPFAVALVIAWLGRLPAKTTGKESLT